VLSPSLPRRRSSRARLSHLRFSLLLIFISISRALFFFLFFYFAPALSSVVEEEMLQLARWWFVFLVLGTVVVLAWTVQAGAGAAAAAGGAEEKVEKKKTSGGVAGGKEVDHENQRREVYMVLVVGEPAVVYKGGLPGLTGTAELFMTRRWRKSRHHRYVWMLQALQQTSVTKLQ
jgi:hypothetical protein